MGESPRRHGFKSIWKDNDQNIYCLEHVASVKQIWGGAISGGIVVWSAETGEYVKTIQAHSYLVFKIHAFRAGDKEYVVTCGADNQVSFFLASDPDKPVKQTKLDKRIYCFLTVDDKLYGAGQNILCYWEFKNIKPPRFPNVSRIPQASDFLVDVRCMLLHNDELWLGNGNTITVYNYKENSRLESMGGHNSTINSLILVSENSKKETAVWSGGMDGRVNTYLVTTRARDKLVTDSKEGRGGDSVQINQLIYDAKRNVILAGSADSTIRTYTVDGVLVGNPLKAHSKHVYCMLVVGDHLISGGDDGVHLWEEGTIPNAPSIVDEDALEQSLTVKRKHTKRVTAGDSTNNTPRADAAGASTLELVQPFPDLVSSVPPPGKPADRMRRRTSERDELEFAKMPVQQLYDLLHRARSVDVNMQKSAAIALGRIPAVTDYLVTQVESDNDQQIKQASAVLGMLFVHVKEQSVADIGIADSFAAVLDEERERMEKYRDRRGDYMAKQPRPEVAAAVCKSISSCGNTTANRAALRNTLKPRLEFMMQEGAASVFKNAARALDAIDATELGDDALREAVRVKIRKFSESSVPEERKAAAEAMFALHRNSTLMRRLLLDGILSRLVLACPLEAFPVDVKVKKSIQRIVEWLVVRLAEAYEGSDVSLLLQDEARTVIRKELVILCQNENPLHPDQEANPDDPDVLRRKVVAASAISGIIRLMRSNSAECVYDGLRCAAAVAFVSEHRALLIEAGAVQLAIGLAAHSEADIVSHSAGLLANLSLVHSETSVKALLQNVAATGVLVDLLHTNDVKILQSSCLALANFSDMLWQVPLDQCREVVERLSAEKHLRRLAEMTRSPARRISMHALRAIGLMARTPSVTQRIVNLQVTSGSLLEHAVSQLPLDVAPESLQEGIEREDESIDVIMHAIAFVGRVCQVYEAARSAAALNIVERLTRTLRAANELAVRASSEDADTISALADITTYAMYSLAMHTSVEGAPPNERSIVEHFFEAGAVEALRALLLEASSPLTKVKVLHTLRVLAANSRMQERILQNDIMRALVENITISPEAPHGAQLQRHAVQVVSEVCERHTHSAVPRSAFILVGPLVSVLYAGQEPSRRYSARVFHALVATNAPEWRAQIADGGALMGLVFVLGVTTDPRTRLSAVRTLEALAQERDLGNRLADIGAHMALVACMQRDVSDGELLKAASNALSYLCRNADVNTLLRASIVEPLAELMLHSDMQVAANASLCLAYLSRQEVAHAALMKGALDKLLGLIDTRRSVPEEAHYYAVYIITELTGNEKFRSVLLNPRIALVERFLLLWSHPRQENEREHVVLALANMCKDAEAARLLASSRFDETSSAVDEIVQEALRAPKPAMRKNAIHLLASLADHADTQPLVLQKIDLATVKSFVEDESCLVPSTALLAALSSDYKSRSDIVLHRSVITVFLNALNGSRDESLFAEAAKLFRVLSRYRLQAHDAQTYDQAIVTGVVKILGGSDVNTQKNALEALRNLTKEDQSSNRRRCVEVSGMEKVNSLFKSRDTALQIACLKVLSNLAIEPSARGRLLRLSIEPLLVQKMEPSNDPSVRRLACGVCANYCAEGEASAKLVQAGLLERLTAILRDTSSKNAPVREAAILALMKVAAKRAIDTTRARDLAPVLVEILREGDATLKGHVLTTLVYLRDEAILGQLVQSDVFSVVNDLLGHSESGVLLSALRLVAALCKRELPASKVLRTGTLVSVSRLVNHDNADVQGAVAEIFARLSKHESLRAELLRLDIIQHLVVLMRSQHAQARYRALKGVNFLGKNPSFCARLVAEDALSPLVVLMMDNDRKVQTMATGTLVNISRAKENVVPVLEAGTFGSLVSLMLYGPRADIQENAAKCIVNIAKAPEGRQSIVEGGGLVPIAMALMAPLKEVRYLCVIATQFLSADALVAGKLLSVNVLTPLKAMVDAKDMDIVPNVLQCLLHLASNPDTAPHVLSAGGMDVVRTLRGKLSKNEDISALMMLEEKLSVTEPASGPPASSSARQLSAKAKSSPRMSPRTSPRAGLPPSSAAAASQPAPEGLAIPDVRKTQFARRPPAAAQKAS